jgi:hypothetical protein
MGAAAMGGSYAWAPVADLLWSLGPIWLFGLLIGVLVSVCPGVLGRQGSRSGGPTLIRRAPPPAAPPAHQGKEFDRPPAPEAAHAGLPRHPHRAVSVARLFSVPRRPRLTIAAVLASQGGVEALHASRHVPRPGAGAGEVAGRARLELGVARERRAHTQRDRAGGAAECGRQHQQRQLVRRRRGDC